MPGSRLVWLDEAGVERRGAASAETPQSQRLDAVPFRPKVAIARLEYKRRLVGKIGSSTAAGAGLRIDVFGQSSRHFDFRFVSQNETPETIGATIPVRRQAGDFSNPRRTIGVAEISFMPLNVFWSRWNHFVL